MRTGQVTEVELLDEKVALGALPCSMSQEGQYAVGAPTTLHMAHQHQDHQERR